VSKQYKRICFVNTGIHIRRPISAIMNILKEKDYIVSILTPRKKSEIKRKESRHYDNFKGINLLTYPIWTKSSGYIWPIPINWEFFKKSWKMLKENDIIHVWVPFYPNTFIICLLKILFFRKKKLILTMDTIPSYSFKVSNVLDVFFKIFFRTIGKLAFLASNFITVYGNSFLKYTEKIKLPRNKVRVTPTGINIDTKNPDKDIREIFNIKNSDKIVLFVGHINKRKGIDLIIKTADLLKDKNIKFLVVGDGPEREKSIKSVYNSGLDGKVIFAGNRFDVHNFYKAADIFFLPSRGEGLAGVLMEAMIYQVPIVTSNITGTRDLVSNLKNGLLCETENYECYAMSIEKLLKDEKLRNKFKENGLRKIKEEYLWEKNIKTFKVIYKSIGNKSP